MVVAGPTGSGKTALAAELARRLGGELVCADSRQVYAGFDAGTAKERPEGVATHLLDVAAPAERYSAGRFLEDALAAVAAIRARGRHPIVVGGTGLYIKALLEGLSPLPARDEETRARLEEEWARVGERPLRERLGALDPKLARAIPAGNKQRLIRALEVAESTGRSLSSFWSRRQNAAPGPWLCLRIEWPSEALRSRLRARCRALWPGLLAEVRRLRRGLDGSEPAFQSLGYREALAAVEAGLPEEEAYARFERATLAYAKRQRTWFNRQLQARPIAGGEASRMAEDAVRAVLEAER
ncbi:MAG: tRNA (adenosine(37)-N6)-dimethylallyltransferase MiaA [Elusimicrobia bacterium]|nr:tRNA (adenosine(37)-N6)-dimethylallyltransferase MiaA [Elusimicrobiota bacterium]MDE2237096.1 tRNA (adenosine(37)-N6)-dimethylallyltransferase MiaA [Elusimicrobiota bacterium]MDE2425855.1 tRNA (adenosine(37)-N6)-dimethylallyltransferase MiaA [Elusimicrobiota bacterium]